MVLKETGKVIGTCGFVNWNHGHYCGELGYSLARRYWNKGLTTEAIRKAIEYGFVKIKLNRIEARCQVDNPASERVMQKVGMKFEGIQREIMYVKKKFRSLKIYSILLSDFKKMIKE
jgi:ribosomal-protein-alanine N-acetyltransferase